MKNKFSGSSKNTAQSKKAMLTTLEKSSGLVSLASKMTNIEMSTFYDWLQTDPDFKKEFQNINESVMDELNKLSNEDFIRS